MSPRFFWLSSMHGSAEIQNENNCIFIDLARSLQHYLQFDDCFNRAAFIFTSSHYFYRCHIYYVVITGKLYNISILQNSSKQLII